MSFQRRWGDGDNLRVSNWKNLKYDTFSLIRMATVAASMFRACAVCSYFVLRLINNMGSHYPTVLRRVQITGETSTISRDICTPDIFAKFARTEITIWRLR